MEEVDMLTNETNQNQDGDDLYTSLATKLTIRKCRMEQKKEKNKLLCSRIKKLNSELKHLVKENFDFIKQNKEISHQASFKWSSLMEVKQSAAALEKVLCDLNNKVSNIRNGNKEKREKYREKMNKASKTWESYKVMYEAFPLAQKRRKLIIEKKKQDIKLKEIKMCIEDFKIRETLRKKITEKRRHIWGVKVARAYFTIQDKISEHNTNLTRLSELKNQIKNFNESKSEKSETKGHQSEDFPQWASERNEAIKERVQSLKFQLNIPQIQAPSPPKTVAEPVSEVKKLDYSIFNRKAFSSGFSCSRNTQNKLIEEVNKMLSTTSYEAQKTKAQPPFAESAYKTYNLSSVKDLSKQPRNDESALKTGQYSLISKPISQTESKTVTKEKAKSIGNSVPIKSINKFTNILHEMNKKTDETSTFKRKFKLTNENQTEQPSQQQKKAACENNISDKNKGKEKVGDCDQINSENTKTIQKNITIDDKLENSQHENNSVVNKSYDLSTIKSLMSSLTANSIDKTTRIVSTEKPNDQSDTNKPVKDISQVADKPYKTYNISSVNSVKDTSKQSRNYEPTINTSQKENHDKYQVEVDLFADDVPGNIPEALQSNSVTMNPNSPPDLVPVESNSQGKCSVFSGEFNSPLELDEAAKLHYQRIAAESPGFVYPRGPELMNTHKTVTEEQNKVTSQYFSSSLQSELNTPTSIPEEHYQPMTYSSPTCPDIQNDPPYLTNVISPPPGNTGFSGEPNSPPGEQFAGGGFSFSFRGPAKNKSSIFSLF